jgi:hypothetical protein
LKGGVEDVDAPHDALKEMKAAMHGLATHKPETVRGAREALRVALEIMRTRSIDRRCDMTMNEGPVLDIVANVYHLMEGLDGDLRPIAED